MTPGRTGPAGFFRHAAALAACCAFAPAAGAEDVRLFVTDTATEPFATGELLGFDGEFIRIGTTVGELTLDYTKLHCEGAACPDSTQFVPAIRFAGAPQFGQGILAPLIEGFARERDWALVRVEIGPDLFRYSLRDRASSAELGRFSVHLSTSAEGLADLVANEADIALTTRALTPDELAMAQDAGLGRLDAPGRSDIVALDAAVPVTAPGQVVKALSVEDLARAFSGEVTNWAAFGGMDAPIALHLGDQTSGVAQGFIDIVLTATGRTLAPSVVRHPTDAGLLAAIIADPDALGVLAFGTFGDAQPLVMRDKCGLIARLQADTIRTRDYPLTLPLFLYRPARRLPPIGAEFIAWLRTAGAQLVLRRAGVLGQEAVPIPLAAQGERLAAAITAAGPDVTLGELQRLIRVLRGQVRLSPTFRFDPGSTRLDAPSRSNLLNLAQAIRDGRYAGQTLMLVGFSDGRGPALANRDLASARAEAVKRELLAVLGGLLPDTMRLQTEAFGEALPMGCDDSLWGQQINRRVELWTRVPL
jgi:phosphate transport system substrate-binding protein